MAKLNSIVTRCKSSNVSIDKICKIKKYIPIKDKFNFLKKYGELINAHINDYPEYKSFVAFVFFNLMIVKEYTDIELDLTYEEFDMLQENKIIDKIVEVVSDEYKLLLSLIKDGNDNLVDNKQ